MKCKFCQEECVVGEWDGVYSQSSTIYECHKHPHVVKHYVVLETYHKGGFCNGPGCCPKPDWHATIVQFQYRGTIWCVNWFLGNDKYPGPRLRIDRLNPKGKGGHVVVDLPFHPPDLTPENLEVKVPKYITFS